MNFVKIADGLRLIADGLQELGQIEVAETPDPVPPAPVPETKSEPAVFQMPSAPAPAPVPPAPEPVAVTKEDVVAAFQLLAQKKGQTQANDLVVEILKENGLAKVSDAAPEQLSVILRRIQEAAGA